MPGCVECLRLLCFRRPANQPVIKTDADMSLFRAIARRDDWVLPRRPIPNQPSQAQTFASGTWSPVVLQNITRSLWNRGAGRVLAVQWVMMSC